MLKYENINFAYVAGAVLALVVVIVIAISMNKNVEVKVVKKAKSAKKVSFATSVDEKKKKNKPKGFIDYNNIPRLSYEEASRSVGSAPAVNWGVLNATTSAVSLANYDTAPQSTALAVQGSAAPTVSIDFTSNKYIENEPPLSAHGAFYGTL